jgi:hypothetical protein
MANIVFSGKGADKEEALLNLQIEFLKKYSSSLNKIERAGDHVLFSFSDISGQKAKGGCGCSCGGSAGEGGGQG